MNHFNIMFLTFGLIDCAAIIYVSNIPELYVLSNAKCIVKCTMANVAVFDVVFMWSIL